MSWIVRRTPSLRTRVAFATAIGAAIVVTIVGTIVWIGITNDRLERLDRRLDEAAGFAVPFVPRGLEQIPPSPNVRDVVITVHRGAEVRSNSDVVLPEVDSDYATIVVDGVRYRVRNVAIPYPEPPTTLQVGATYDDTIADTNNLHRRVLIICASAIGAAAVLGWLLAAFAVRPLRRLAEQTRAIDAGDVAPDVDVSGATEAVEIGEALKGLLERIWTEQDRTKAALDSARDFAAVSAHELRTPLTAMRTNLEVLSTLDLPDEQREEVIGDVIRTQSRIEATLGALERLAQGELSTSADQVPVDITELLDRAAHDDMTAVLSGTGADVDDPVGYADGVLIVLDDDERIAEVTKSDKCLDEPAVIALVKADARLIENVEHPDKPGADLCREANALSLTAGEGGRRPVQRKVMQSDIDEELQSLIHLLEDATGNRGIAIGQRKTAEHRR